MEAINLEGKKPDIRRLSDLKEVVFDKKWLEGAADRDLYFMYRGLDKKDGLRYDITIIPSLLMGSEFVKTKGHKHLGNFSEVYTVIAGRAIYLMQKWKDDGCIEDVYAVFAEKGDTVAIPSGYGHTTINPDGILELEMANWVCVACKSDYSFYEKMGGACYFFTEGGWIKNPSYQSVPDLRFEKPLKNIPENLDFLKVG